MEMNAEARFRNKVTWMTFLFSVLVVMIHGNNLDLFINVSESGRLAAAARGLEGLISEAMPTVAVPGFFMVSAYLFCRNLTWEKLPGKMLRRVGSVLVPYIAWNSLYYFAMAFAGMIPGLRELSGKAGVTFSVAGWADAILHYRYNPVLWYMQQLIFLIALAPVIYWLMSRIWLGAAALLLLLFVLGKGAVIPILNLDALLYYSVGAYLGIHGKKAVEQMKIRHCLVKTGAVLLGVLICAGLFVGSRRYYSVLMTVLYGVLSPMAVWIALPDRLPEPAGFMKYNFFLYAYHFLLVRGINKVGALFLPSGAGTALTVYLALPFLVIGINWLTAVFFRKYLPPIWRLLNGGR